MALFSHFGWLTNMRALSLQPLVPAVTQGFARDYPRTYTRIERNTIRAHAPGAAPFIHVKGVDKVNFAFICFVTSYLCNTGGRPGVGGQIMVIGAPPPSVCALCVCVWCVWAAFACACVSRRDAFISRLCQKRVRRVQGGGFGALCVHKRDDGWSSGWVVSEMRSPHVCECVRVKMTSAWRSARRLWRKLHTYFIVISRRRGAERTTQS